MAGGAAPRMGEVPTAALDSALQEQGLWLDLGSARVRVQGDSRYLAAQLQAVYPEFPLEPHGNWADIHCRLDQASGWRRWLRPQAVFSSDGRTIFAPFPGDAPLPLFEWGCNWLLGQRLNHLLLFHAGALERDGHALVLPATPGSGKSTLAAALSLRGWRLLSDEFGVFDPPGRQFRAMLKPVALKNESIDVIRSFDPQARLGPEFPKTRKGTVAHLAACTDAVTRRHQGAKPGAVVLPRWQAGGGTRWRPLAAHDMFAALAFNAFNYQLLGEAGFDAVVDLARNCLAWELVYSDLDDAVKTIDDAWPQVLERSHDERQC